MVPSPLSTTYSYNFWNDDPPDVLELSCLMPTGVMVFLQACQTATLQEVKEDLWEEAERYPLFGLLRDKSMYVLSAITDVAKATALLDETKRLCDVQPTFCILKIEEKKVSTNQTLVSNINGLIGKAIDFGSLKNPEINGFRHKMSNLGEDVSSKRIKMTWAEKLMYQYPPRLSLTKEIPLIVKSRLRDNKFVLVAKFYNEENSFTFRVNCFWKPSRLLELILSKQAVRKNKRAHEYVLKFSGREEYLFGDYNVIDFVYIQELIARDLVPTVVVQPMQHVDVFEESIYESPDLYLGTSMDDSKRQTSTCTLKKKQKHVSSYDIEDNFEITIHSIERLNCDSNRTVEAGIQVGLFHGGKSLCETKKTMERTLQPQGCGSWDETLTFDISVRNVPRMARLCLVVYETAKNLKNGGMRVRRMKENNKDLYVNPLAWVNTTIYDFKNQLKQGQVTLYTWNYAEDAQSDDILHRLGTVESNPRIESTSSIIISFSNYNIDTTIIYPSTERLIEHAQHFAAIDTLNRDSAQDVRPIGEILGQYMVNARFNEMHDQERNAIWAKRLDCLRQAPEGLPCLLHCVEWNKFHEVAEITHLLQQWQPLKVDRALELLDYAYADQNVRSFAVNCLRTLHDDELQLYLLQLVQAIKHESYLMCDLVEFLLLRALKNQRTGHFFFWHLRSEMQVPSVQIRFGLLLEAYLKGSQEHIPTLLQQVECLKELRQWSELAKKGGKDKARSNLMDHLKGAICLKNSQGMLNPLDPRYRCKNIKPDKCKIMDSKMRPLWVVFDNYDMHGEDIYVIFKNGDDLRQDMLTLQMLRVMDRIWKSHGLDFRMNPYNCISTESRLGMIEVVLNAETIANIQKDKGMFSATAFKKGSLLAWLKEHNQAEGALQKAIMEFTLSCAGYCVATYVLGVADRHSDNIMVKKTGQLFHIDFGHILGHFKEKFGFRRERVPFVLTHDFVYVINNGCINREADEFRKFQDLCEEAFLLLRKHGCLILSLFAMMIQTGLPELSSEKDIHYLRETLVLDRSEAEARKHFQSKFSEALANSWKTSLNWASHNFSKNNKQ